MSDITLENLSYYHAKGTPYEIKALDDKMTYSYEGGNTIVKINTEGANGKPFTLRF